MSGGAVIGREHLLTLVPHAGSMCLLDQVLEYSASHIVCIAHSHRDSQNPLRRDGQLQALHLVEYAAQAIAAHGALVAGGVAQPGMLAALRNIKLHVEHIDTIAAPLTVTVRQQLAQPDGLLYDFDITAGSRHLCEGRMAIALS